MTFKSFHSDFRFGAYGAPSTTTVSAIAVGTQQIGALIGCFAIWPVNNLYGRRTAIKVCSLVFCIGVGLELLNLHSLSVFFTGRVIAGLGVGGSSSVIPIYLSEMAPKQIRGQLGSVFQFMFTVGIFASYWIDYAVGFMTPQTAQWRIPIALQLVPGGLMGLGVETLHESIRWLVANEDMERATASLKWIRALPINNGGGGGGGGEGIDGIEERNRIIAEEIADLKAGIEEEAVAKAGFSAWELLEWPNLHRILLAVGIFLAQQSTGATALAYFGPQFFTLIVGPGDTTLLLTGIFGLVKVVSCGIFIVVLSDRFGRKKLLFLGAALMAIGMFATAAMFRFIRLDYDYDNNNTNNSLNSNDSNDSNDSSSLNTISDGSSSTNSNSSRPISAASIVTIMLIYVTIAIFNLSWGPLPWPYVSEIFPMRIRESGVACGVGSQWLFNLIWSSVTPYLLSSDLGGFGTFGLFGVMCLGVCAFVVFALKETVNKSLEEINTMF